MGSVHTAEVPLVPLFEKREELRRVLESKIFVNSPKKTRFLDFVCEQTFLGNGEKLNEYLIGVEVYERGVDFNPQKDPIVRVQAHEIRRLLKKYYEEDGKANPMRMDLPAGHYVPIFARNAEQAPADEVGPTPGTEEKQDAGARLPWALAVVFGVACVVLAGLFASGWNRRGPETRLQPTVMPDSLTWFWKPFLPPADAPLITIPNHPLLRAAHDGDSAQTLAGGHEIPKSSLPEFRDTIHFHELKRFIFVPTLTDFTSVGETLGVVNLCDMFSSVGQKCRVQQSRLVNLDEIKGDNAILLGGNQAWSGRVFLNKEGFQFQSGVIFNRSPHPGEQPVYRPEFDSVTNQLTRDYALVLLLPNETNDKRVLLIYGIYTQGSQAAIEFLTNPEHMSELRKTLLDLAPDHKTIPPYFQLLLTTTVENSVPGKSSLVAVRTIPG
ncbi:MAG TPA: hypothetical protein VE377_12850 [Candidatus Dormibacteraeota bacterium]|nr:hypothetical protein [Candidatus Dormibacteraeota bacterium]